MSRSKSILCVAIAAMVANESWLYAQEDEITVGRSGAGKLKALVEFEPPLELPPSIFPGITGYATGELGIHSALFSVPTNDFFMLSTSEDVQFILDAKDPGMEVWNNNGSAFMT